ncbi:tripartite tricarboxylate transporter TctB family protein [Aureimonas mangrovi]|uniref:tripartite tricarboxylate transporter TctB family protein n=1 Tax=Aureimonas mangrovi TaxID=2758041 RepID=UPI00163DA6B3|nr:tripartite tricarboxylate transporter TctB family protein [Aureimonas mangrovi]
MTTNRADQIFAVLLILLGCYVVWSGIGYGYMAGTAPGAGFFPVILGIAIAMLSVVNLLRSLLGAEQLTKGIESRDLAKIAGVTVALVLLIVATPYVGITVASIGLMLAIALIIRPSAEPAYLSRIVACSVFVPLFCRVAFGNWLNIPLPTGPFGL